MTPTSLCPDSALARSIPSGLSLVTSTGASRSNSYPTKPFVLDPNSPLRNTVAFSVQEHGEKDTVRGSAVVGVPTAVARSMLLQALSFWYRVPIKVCWESVPSNNCFIFSRGGTIFYFA